MRNALIAAQKNCLAAGLTTVDDAGLEKEVIDLIDDMHQKGELIIKVYAMANPSKENLDYFLKNGPLLHERLTVRSFKVYVDGAFGSRGALLLQPYSDGEAHHHGLLLNEKKIIQDLAEQAYDADFQLCAHAIGDSANRLMLDIYGEQLRGVNDKRWRIEHAQLLNPMDFKRFKEYTIIPSVQPTHATSDMYWAADRIGAERVKYAYAYRTLLDQNKMVALGTDFPVEEIYPLHTFYAAVTRKDGKGYPEKGYAPAHVLSRREALKGMTIWAAISNFEETEKGSLEKGKVADFVILDHDIMKIDEKRIRSTKVKYTAINGSIVYQSGTN
jgi:predicted amidohydrolase YtcJ